MSITTKRGDAGETSLYSGERVPKYAVRLEAVGDLDELVSALGVARSWVEGDTTRAILLDLQRRLFLVGSEIATSPEQLALLTRRLDADAVRELDAARDALEARVNAPRGFILPGEARGAAFLDLARAIARRCERHIARLRADGVFVNDHVLVWMNRLSDYLWLLARSEETSRPVISGASQSGA